MTDKTKQALTILSQYPKGVSCAFFAEKMWPDSPMHRKVSNQGNGATRGKAAWLCAGSYLAKLRQQGLVSKDANGLYTLARGVKL
jgi:hypothetical protein